ncbi:glycosyltransferase [Flavobacterium sp. NRK F7]|uniref:glycosyltransferase n=1 Tax=Flavobacterium sp. NRK F7 TaxID=2954930 RepID=UPI00209051A5|nr:glycosyltransferase [Flavobacterium sp. NRK F7]MCO6162042.1 glycosyltransferase [Flavobacterium sp. NRK F7]
MPKRILIAPLNWGLGHATRCIPIIRALEKNNFEPIIASDGVSLELLKKEFPHLNSITLPSYNITYAEKGKNFKLKLISQLPHIFKAIRDERKITQKLIEKYDIEGIISDNRLGVYATKIPSVFITHQLNVLTGNTTWLTTKLHHYFIKKFNECWVPDKEKGPNLSGDLGHLEEPFKNIKYIGPLSRLYKKNSPNKYDLMIILSGPEPQRTLLEEKLILELKKSKDKILFIKGIVEAEQKIEEVKNITYYNFMTSEQIETAFNESDKILTRSGYTTVMDLAQLEKKAFFIPTPGQYEQEYLAKKFKKEGIAPSCKQESFDLSKLNKIDLYRGFSNYTTDVSWKKLFRLF